MRQIVVALALVIGPLAFAGPAASAPAVTCDGRRATIVGTNGKDRLVGTPGPDVIAGLRGNDVIFGLGGDDVICGNGGRDVLLGGPGDDRLYGGRDFESYDQGGAFLNGDRLVGGPGDDLLDVGVDPRKVDEARNGNVVDYSGSTSGVTVHLAAHGLGAAAGPAIGDDRIVARPDLELVATTYDDTIVGSNGPDSIDAGPGDDVIHGRGGDDSIAPDGDGLARGASDDDTVDGGPGADQVYSYLGRDTLIGGSGDDALVDYSPAPGTIRGNGGDDGMVSYLTRASGWDIDGGPGAKDDITLYLPDKALTTGLLSLDEVTGAASIAYPKPSTGRLIRTERVTVFDGVPVDFRGTDASEYLDAGLADGSGAVHAEMGGGDDVVYGEDGDDYVDGGPGVDTVHGRQGDDVCAHTEHADSCHAPS